MGLLARLKGKGKSGINEDEGLVRRLKKRQWLMQLVQARLSQLSSLLLIAGFICMAVIPAAPLGKALRVSENAVQAGQVTTYWDWQDVFVADKFAQDVEEWSQLSASARSGNIAQTFRELGLPAAVQAYNFTDTTGCAGVNSYAVLKAPKTDGSEAIVLGASWLSRDGQRVNTRGVALLLGLAKYLSKYAVWSKDIIFLMSDGYSEGAHAWISEYHGLHQTNLHTEPHPLASGSIWAAVHLDYPHHSFSKIGLYFEGVNGLLPNLDLIAAASHITRWIGNVPPLINNASDVLRSDRHSGGLLDHNLLKEYELALGNVLEQVKKQSIGSASGPEGVYAPYRIDALALFAVPAQGPHGFYALGKVAEASLRSINNLLERFHASAFLYILSAPRRFVPLAHYLAAPLLCGLAFSFKGLGIWGQLVQGDGLRQHALLPALAVVMTTHIYGALVHQALKACHTPDQVNSLAWLLVPTSASLAVSTAVVAPTESVQVLRAIHLLLAGMVVSVAAVVNFSLAGLSASLMAISYYFGTPSRTIALQVPKLCMLAATSVLVVAALLPESLLAGLLYDWRILNVWFLDFATLIIMPLQLQASILCCTTPLSL